MNKGVVFTMDAIVALAIFIASLFVFYSYFVAVEPFGLRGAGIYTKADNFLSAEDASEDFSKVLYYYQVADNRVCNSSSLSYQQLANISKNLTEYPSNIRFYVYNESTKDVSLICSYSPNVFSDKVILRRYVTLSRTRNITESSQNATCGLNTTRANRTIPISTTIQIPGPFPVPNVIVNVTVYNNDSINMSTWNESIPQSIGTVMPGIPYNLGFSITIPSTAWIDEYKAIVVAANSTYTVAGKASCSFNVVEFGMVELEVGV